MHTLLLVLSAVWTVSRAHPEHWFVSYGDRRFAHSLKRIQLQAQRMRAFEHVRVFTPSDIDAGFRRMTMCCIEQRRGGGYYLWKPWVVNHTLSLMRDGDYLVYADAGCHLLTTGRPRLLQYFDLLAPSRNVSIAAFNTGTVEGFWTSERLFRHFGVAHDSAGEAVRVSKQHIAGVMVIRKANESVSLIRRWAVTARDHPRLFTDEYNRESRALNPSFKENRHDQSCFSLLTKLPEYRDHVLRLHNEVAGVPNTFPIHTERGLHSFSSIESA